ncbi:MAG: UDP-N-acetylglucosamine 2-epimerase (non-hydrolyzing) [Pirellulaceae bacterium]|nr:UDP-N-acetylglucosamine 2-epimerase (non-hydrolyzing) [Pirellulaceae bacterium]
MARLKPLLVLGTRPEAIKMAPVVAACRERTTIDPVVCFTGQHDEMLRQVTDYFEIQPDFDLKLLAPGQSLAQLTARSLVALDEVLQASRPGCVVAQGDTTSVLAASMAAFYRQIPFVHVEAGLRTGNLAAPFPEEFNRKVATITTTLHCAPTSQSAENLRREGIAAEQIKVTGNTVIDALLATVERERQNSAWSERHGYLAERELVLITAHRRENHGAGLDQVFQAVANLARRFPAVVFVFPVHLNPQVQEAARRLLAGFENIRLLGPLPYPEFVWLMDRSKFIISDSGGVQEEAPSLRRPVLALRESTERPEGVEIGAVELVGCSPEKIDAAATRLLTDPRAYAAMQPGHSPFGDGRAATRIVAWMEERL